VVGRTGLQRAVLQGPAQRKAGRKQQQHRWQQQQADAHGRRHPRHHSWLTAAFGGNWSSSAACSRQWLC
jgi:hypothetical protein